MDGSPLVFAPTVVCCLSCALMVNAERIDSAPQRAAFKSLAAAGFIANGLVLGALSAGLHGQLLAAGLILGAIGDLLLLPEDNRPAFMAGIGTFGLSHVAYTAMFIALGFSALGLASLVLLLPLLWLIWTWLRDHVGKLKGAVAGYIIVITAMVTAAACALAAEPDLGHGVLLFAAIVFFLSDLLVARQRFVSPDVRNRYLGLPLYFGAQLAFGWGMWLL